jgi:UDP-N-acetylmuramate dehydrogenase
VRRVEPVDLSAANTLRLPSQANALIELEALEELPVLMQAIGRAPRVQILGGGSNVLLAEKIDALIVRAANRGITIDADREHFRVTVGAGEPWAELIEQLCAQGIGGIENLALIPGLTGAAPVQNIGAYGVEMKQHVALVDSVDLHTGERLRRAAADCGFGYRDSRFKRAPNRELIVQITLALDRRWTPKLDYPGVRERIGGTPTPASVCAAISAIRREKLPDPTVIPNAGSFFKNPLVTTTHALKLKQQHPTMPQWPSAQPEQTKLSAAWLIEATGWRGRALGAVAVSAQHALVLTNPKHAPLAELMRLSDAISSAVNERFNVALEREPVLVD